MKEGEKWTVRERERLFVKRQLKDVEKSQEPHNS